MTQITDTQSMSHDTRPVSRLILWATFVVALLTLAGSLALSLALDLRACPLCFYQRTFAMSLVAVLGLGLLTGMARQVRLGILALPLAVAGLGVAAFHVWLEVSGKLECPPGIYDLGTAPQQSLATFIVLCALLLVELLQAGSGPPPWYGVVGGLVAGTVLAYASTVANPPMPPVPTAPYKEELKICRPPYRPGG